MSIGLILFVGMSAGVAVYFMTPHGRQVWKGARSNVLFILGQAILVADQMLTQIQGFNWDAYLDKSEALICSVLTLLLSGFFSALKRTEL